MASGGLSHVVIDEGLDQLTIGALMKKDCEKLWRLPRGKLRGGTSEILNWVALAGAVEPMDDWWDGYADKGQFPEGVMQRIATSFGDIAIESHGSGSPVVLLHSGGHDRHDFDAVVPTLAKRFRTIAVDLPGHGDSDRFTPPAHASARRICAAVAEVEGRLVGFLLAEVRARLLASELRESTSGPLRAGERSGAVYLQSKTASATRDQNVL